MKKIYIVILLLLCFICLVGCDTNGHYEDSYAKVVDKYTSLESSYNWFLESYKTYTVYYIVLANGEYFKVNVHQYNQYQIGDLYPISIWVEDE